MQQKSVRSSSESYFWPTVWAVTIHVLLFAMLFVSFHFAPELPPARPIVQATLYQLKSQSQATTQTTQKIAGEAQKTKARQYEVEQLETKKEEQQKQEAAEQKKVAAAKQAEEKKQAEAKKAEEAKKAAEQKKLAEVAKKKAEEEKKKAAAEEARKKAAEQAKKKAAEDAKKKAAAAEAAKKKKAQEAARKAAEDKKAQALAELLGDTTERQQALADEVGDKVAGSLDDLIIKLVSEQWQRPPSARNGMSVEVLIQMLPDGTIVNASVTRSSGDAPFDSSAVAAVKNVVRIPEMQQVDSATFNAMYRQRRMIFKPEDLSL
ncbi:MULTISPECIES: cell envelope integrity protein TolA [Pseudomonadaceae]|jgi:colicin import membrane protein|uniref:Cell envelope integrity protein TolA n=1 Tax=Aquipseudomonas alcaligenes TaxID=43263 RepID=A0A5C7WFQ0_AQUAC|nr:MULTISPECIES: cell envelope integrity protein TolA [Pseudomonas]MDH0141253.1 cell envelope integrity protein TolA [Pseudomonas alcaligenes]MDH1054605.1 cell envelope integrity protein TolA [Pseudomonas alcaligenes]MEE1951330.1 cell envelope integrity protein TolA [Pseudomonas alcaligenes]NMY40286.1 cell envelope integrity protein TolA [Pseudomonas sp. WS 5013]TXI35484.1 MAG: cell envelope integrity protein TolA [Pseudomonas alcaligenes]